MRKWPFYVFSLAIAGMAVAACRPCYAEDVEIRQEQNRSKAAIPSEAPAAGKKHNIVYRGFLGVLHGIYHTAKFGVDGLGFVTEKTVQAVQWTGGKAFNAASRPFHKEEKQQ